MKNRYLVLIILLAFAIFLPSPAWAQHPTSADAYVDETKTTNFGAATTLQVSQPSLETFIRFDLSGLPSGITGTSVGKATLVLYVSAVTTAGTFDVSEVSGAWNELTITGGNEPGLGTLITPGVAIAAANKNNFVVIDVTAAVKDWLNGTANNGLALAPNGTAVNVTFNSKESITTSHNPQLNISLIEPPGEITQITAGTGLTGGGSTGNVIVAVDSTQVPFLSFPNTFTANQTVVGSLSASSLIGNGSLLSNLNPANISPGTAGISITGSSASASTATNALNLGGQPPSFYASTGANTFSATQTISSGDLAISTGNLALPDTNGTGTAGVVTINGNPFLHDCCGANNFNVFVGRAGNFTTTGLQNTAIGYQALSQNTTGTYNTAVGYQSMLTNTAGPYNTAIGYQTLQANRGFYNTASGFGALQANTTGGSNTASGYESLYSNTLGSSNTAVGYAAGVNSGLTLPTNGSNSTFIGASATATVDGLTNATAIGYNAQVSASNSLVLGQSGTNVGIGTASPAANLEVNGTSKFDGLITFAGGQTFPGAGTVTSVATGAGLTGGPITTSGAISIPSAGVINAMLANYSLSVNAGTDLTGGGAVALGGSTTLNLNTAALQTTTDLRYAQLAAPNTFTGTQTISGNLALPATTSSAAGVITMGGLSLLHACCSVGSQNTFVGVGAGNFTTTGLYNTASGLVALSSNTTGHDNTASGAQALYANNSGYFNTANGSFALFSNTTGNDNTASGYQALQAVTTAGGNTASGFQALYSSTTGDNTASGSQALYSDTTGKQNTAAGVRSGFANATGSYNTFLGSFADATSDGLTNATAIGWSARVSASNSLVLGYGVNVGIGTTAPNAKLDILPASNQHILLGDPGCGAGFGGIGFQSSLTCNNYALIGDSVNTYINRQLGGQIVFRENNSTQVQINPGGNSHLIDTSTTANLSSSGFWNNASDRNLKTSFRAVNGRQILKLLNAVPIQSWSYKKEPGSIRHVGPMAQDFRAAFGLGEDDKHIGTVDADGVALAAIQELYRAGLKKDAKIRSQQASIDDLYAMGQRKEAQIRKLTADVQELLRDRGEVAALEARLLRLEGERQSARLLAKR